MTKMTTFKEAYAILQKHAQTLRSQQEPDIDNLTTIVSESLVAHRVCKERIDAVEKALEESLGSAGGEENVAASGQRSPALGSGGSPGDGDGGDDVPF